MGKRGEAEADFRRECRSRAVERKRTSSVVPMHVFVASDKTGGAVLCKMEKTPSLLSKQKGQT
jgi:hypothetical protein